MEYLTLHDIPQRHYDQVHSRRMTSQSSSERPLGNMVAAVSENYDPSSIPSLSPTFLASRTLPPPVHTKLATERALYDDPFLPELRVHPQQQRATALLEQRAPPLHFIHLPKLSQPRPSMLDQHVLMRHSITSPTSPSLHLSPQSPSPPAHQMSLSPSLRKRRHKHEPQATEETSGVLESAAWQPRRINKEQSNSTLTESQNHHMRSSPPIQPGEQNHVGKLPSFSEFLSTTRQQTPPRTPSRRNGSADSSPHARPQFDDVAWTDGKRRRVDTLGDIYARPSGTEHHSVETRRTSNAIDPTLTGYRSPRPVQRIVAQSTGAVHHRPSHSYPPPHLRQQTSPAPLAYPHQLPHQNSLTQNAYPASIPPHSTNYEHRSSYYQDPQPPVLGYDRPSDSYYGRPSFSGPSHPGYDNSYGELRFQQHVGLDHNAFNRKRRGNLPKEATNLLKDWFNANRQSPYPTEDQKMDLCNRTGLSLNQVSNWFINARRRAPQKEQREREANGSEV